MCIFVFSVFLSIFLHFISLIFLTVMSVSIFNFFHIFKDFKKILSFNAALVYFLCICNFHLNCATSLWLSELCLFLHILLLASARERVFFRVHLAFGWRQPVSWVSLNKSLPHFIDYDVLFVKFQNSYIPQIQHCLIFNNPIASFHFFIDDKKDLKTLKWNQLNMNFSLSIDFLRHKTFKYTLS